MNKNEQDVKAFTEVWVAAAEVYGATLTDAAVTMSFSVLAKYSINEIKQAVQQYLGDPANPNFAPKPANIIALIEHKNNQDGRPESDEAWATALLSFDEHKTVVLSEEMAKALESASVVFRSGDKIGARMAFRACYEREVIEARKNRVPVKWFPSLGFDAESRRDVLEKAVERGQLPAPQVKALLPPPNDGIQSIENLLEHKPEKFEPVIIPAELCDLAKKILVNHPPKKNEEAA